MIRLVLEKVRYGESLRSASLIVQSGEIVSVQGQKRDRLALLEVAYGRPKLQAGRIRRSGRAVVVTSMWQDIAGPTVVGQLALAMLPVSPTVAQAHLNAREALNAWGLEKWSTCALDDLEGWELRKLSLLRALVVKPDLVVFDCELSAYTGADELWAMLYEARSHGMGILVMSGQAPKKPVDAEYELDEGVLRGTLRLV